MRIHTLTIQEEINGVWITVADSSYEYSGPILSAKKGREEQDQLIKQQQSQATQEAARQQQQFQIQAQQQAKAEEDRQATLAQQQKVKDLVSPYENLADNKMSQASNSQYNADLENIGKTYGDLQEAGMRTLASRGFGRAPSGFTASYLNSQNRNRANEETNAYRQGLARTEQQKGVALNAEMGLISPDQAQQQLEQSSSGQYGAEAGASGSRTEADYSGASDSAYKRSQMGSTLGDIASGVGTVASVAAAPFTGGASLAGLAGRIKPKSGIKYGPVQV